MDYLDLPAARGARGTVRLPGSKSISNRILLLAALAEGATEIKALLDSDDTRVMLDALRALGVDWTRRDGSDDYRLMGVGGAFPVKQAELFLGNAGTAFRSLTAATALAGGDYVLKGVSRMHERPIGDLVDALLEPRRASVLPGQGRLPAVGHGPGTGPAGGRGHRQGQCLQPVSDRAAARRAAPGPGSHGQGRW